MRTTDPLNEAFGFATLNKPKKFSKAAGGSDRNTKRGRGSLTTRNDTINEKTLKKRHLRGYRGTNKNLTPQSLYLEEFPLPP